MGMLVNPYRNAAGGGAVGGPLLSVIGNKSYVTASSDSAANARLIKITAPAGVNSLLSAVQVDVNSIGAGVGMKALLVADSSGSPSSTVIAIGTATTPGAVSSTVVALPFASDQTLTAGTAYWIGFVPSAPMSVTLDNGSFAGNAAGYTYGATYASPTWDSTTDTLTTDKHVMWAVVNQAGTATGLHQQGSTALLTSAAKIRMGLPDYAIGDIVRVQLQQDFGTLNATPSGWTKTYDDQINGNAGARHVIYERTMDGTENGTFFIDAPSGNNRTAVATVFRGGGAKEGKTVATSAGTSATSSAVTTAGANRRVFNFFCSGQLNGGTTNTESADTWTDVYVLSSSAGNDPTMSLSYKDVASAGSSGTETRTISNGWWHFTSFAIPDV